MPLHCDDCGKPITSGVYYFNRDAFPVCPTCWPDQQEVDRRIEEANHSPERKAEDERIRQWAIDHGF